MIQYVPYDKLQLGASYFENPRTRSGLGRIELEELARDIGRRGLLNALIVDPNFVILAGQRRYLAMGILAERSVAIARDPEEAMIFKARAADLQRAVPVAVHDISDDVVEAQVLAIVDNLQRSQLSSFEIAGRLAMLHEKGRLDLAGLAQAISKSKSYVSRMLRCWRGAGRELKSAWRTEKISYQRVRELAQLPISAQPAAVARELAPNERKPRGPHGRPGIDAVKGALERARTLAELPRGFVDDHPAYLAGVQDALRFVTGEGQARRLRDLLKET